MALDVGPQFVSLLPLHPRDVVTRLHNTTGLRLTWKVQENKWWEQSAMRHLRLEKTALMCADHITSEYATVIWLCKPGVDGLLIFSLL